MNTPQPTIKLFTAHQLREWLYSNQTAEGLSEAVISRARAAAIVHNPYIKDQDPVAAALYEGDELAAFTASFPDRIGDKTYHWFSTLWCHPAHRGKGYGLLVVGSLCEEFGAENCLDMWGAPETVGIFRYLGHNTTSFPEYQFEPKHIQRGTLKGEAAHLLNCMHRLSRKMKHKPAPPFKEIDYTLRYINHIDNNTYRFIRQYSGNDLIPRSQEMMNWILSHHFKRCTPLMDKESQTNPFDDRDSRYWMSGVCVIVKNQTVGFYIIRDADSELSVKYLYYRPEYRDSVFHSISQHIAALGNPRFSTRNRELADYVSSLNQFDREAVIDVSFSYPDAFCISPTIVSQGGDGDGFV